MSTLNKVIVLGNLGTDPEARTAPSGELIANLRIATTLRRTDKATGGAIEETEWHRVILFRQNAELAKQYLVKGAACLIEGRLQTRKWTDKNGIERYTTEIIGERLVLLGGGKPTAQPTEEPDAPKETPVPPAVKSRDRAKRILAGTADDASSK
jgi:single-strand DNA-binding protein